MIHLIVAICAPILMMVGAFIIALRMDRKLTEYYRNWP